MSEVYLMMPKLRVTTYNVNTDEPADRPLHERLPDMLERLRKIDTDIMCLQGLRDAERHNTALETLTAIGMALKMTFVWICRDGTHDAPVQAILWKPKRVMMIHSSSRWISDELAPVVPPNSDGEHCHSVALTCQFLQRLGDGFYTRFAVTCVHLPEEEDESHKLVCMRTLWRISRNICSDQHIPVLVAGDFNVRMDKRGREQLALMRDDGPVSVRLLPRDCEDPDGHPIGGAFSGDESDPDKRIMGDHAPVDHMFLFYLLPNVSVRQKSVIHVICGEHASVPRQEQTSDHCAVSQDIGF